MNAIFSSMEFCLVWVFWCVSINRPHLYCFFIKLKMLLMLSMVVCPMNLKSEWSTQGSSHLKGKWKPPLFHVGPGDRALPNAAPPHTQTSCAEICPSWVSGWVGLALAQGEGSLPLAFRAFNNIARRHNRPQLPQRLCVLPVLIP